MKKLVYEEIQSLTQSEVETAIRRNNPDELLYVPIAVSLYETDLAFAQDVCIRLSTHEHFNVRGNAILGFGHLARRFKKLDFESIIKPLIEGALKDADNYVRGHADDAADDVEFFLGWKVKRPVHR
jgi:hypothetical protein